jgi:hypothetical protein
LFSEPTFRIQSAKDSEIGLEVWPEILMPDPLGRPPFDIRGVG